MGTSYKACSRIRVIEDHPHACGDKLRLWVGLSLHEGSSPRVWGQVDLSCYRYSHYRIIPTRVGTSVNAIVSNICQRDHPHACGDKSKSPSSNNSSKGSSPRVWGQAFFISFIPPVLRIIPTRVGTSKNSSCSMAVNMDHPHACGDK